MDDYNDDIDRRSLQERWKDACVRRQRDFAAGVNANRGRLTFIACAGCGVMMQPAQLAGVTPFGALCAECHAGINRGR